MFTVHHLVNVISPAGPEFGTAPVEVNVAWLSDEQGAGPDTLFVVRAVVEGVGDARRLMLYTVAGRPWPDERVTST